jgi:hypothetical protein
MFKRVDEPAIKNQLYNKISTRDMNSYFENLSQYAKSLNLSMENNPEYKYYIWPASAHSVALFVNGVNYRKLSGIIDNSPNKVGKVLYGYHLKCYSLDSIIARAADSNKVSIILSGVGDYLNEIRSKIKNTHVTFLSMDDFNTHT